VSLAPTVSEIYVLKKARDT